VWRFTQYLRPGRTLIEERFRANYRSLGFYASGDNVDPFAVVKRAHENVSRSFAIQRRLVETTFSSHD